MAWTTPKTWASGYVVSASDLTTHLRDNLNTTAPAIMSSQGYLLYVSGANTPARLAKNASAQRVLDNSGTNNNPAWAQVSLTTGVTGVLPVANGGTNASSLADKSVLITQDSSTDTVSAAVMDASGELLIGGTSGPAVATLTAGTNITISNGDGTISIATSALGFTAVASGSTAIAGNTATQVATAVMSDAYHYIIWDDSRSTGSGGTIIGSFVQGNETLAATCCANYERSGNGSTTDRIVLTTGEASSVTHVWAAQEIS